MLIVYNFLLTKNVYFFPIQTKFWYKKTPTSLHEKKTGYNFVYGRPHIALPPPPICRRLPEPEPTLPPPCGRHKWMAPCLLLSITMDLYVSEHSHSTFNVHHIGCKTLLYGSTLIEGGISLYSRMWE